MQLFFLHYSGNYCLPYWAVKLGDYIKLGFTKKELQEAIKDENLRRLCLFDYEKFDSSNHYESNWYLGDIFPPDIDEDREEKLIFSAFPYKDSFLDQDDERTEEWRVVHPDKHPYPKLYKQLHPDALVGIVEVIHSDKVSMIKAFYRCCLVGISYLHLPDNDLHDEGNYFLTRHVVVLHPGQELTFDVKVKKDGKEIFLENEAISYKKIKWLLDKST